MDLNICLCYSKEKGLFTRNCVECDETIFSPYEKKGFIERPPIEVPNKDFSIKIYSNFGFQGASYLYANIETGGKRVLDFSLEKLCVLKHASLSDITVATEDWESLLNRIADIYHQPDKFSTFSLIFDYIVSLREMFQSATIMVKRNFHVEKLTPFASESNSLNFIGCKIKDIIDNLKFLNTEEYLIIDNIALLCKEYIKKLKIISINDNDKENLSNIFSSICQFMSLNGHGDEILEIFQN